MGQVSRGPMRVTIDEEGRTRVHDAYVLSTPVAGRLMRVRVDPGDRVERDKTIVAQMRPTSPEVLDLRTREQARAAVHAAEAALRLTRAELNAAQADYDLAQSDLERTSKLEASGTVSEAALDRARTAARAAEARLATAQAAIAIRRAELENARAQLIGFEDLDPRTPVENGYSDEIPIFAPIDGRILRVIQQSETTLPAGTPILEIGDIDNDLEIVAQLISSDAVQVSPGDRVRIEDWGGPEALSGEVVRVDPFGVTKYSALGVEEQRVDVVIRFTDPPEARPTLGHGYRVEVRIVVWEEASALKVPSSALFRSGTDWAVFRVEDGTARLHRVEIGHNNGTTAEVVGGLSEGDAVVLYPSAALSDGARVTQRRIE
ncbi:MAG: efflux RND transporter periplasmic adaptor subunit [Paracoccaceae bacterium]